MNKDFGLQSFGPVGRHVPMDGSFVPPDVEAKLRSHKLDEETILLVGGTIGRAQMRPAGYFLDSMVCLTAQMASDLTDGCACSNSSCSSEL